jgi:serine/threonine protein kinase
MVHDRGRVHLDLHPGNITLSDGRVSMVDFGSASQIGQRVPRRGHRGFIPLEQRRGRGTLSASVDTFVVGGLLVYLLGGGHVPYLGADRSEQTDFRRLGLALYTVASHVGPRYVEVLMTALSSDPKDRYQSASAMIDAIEQCQGEYCFSTPHSTHHVACSVQFGVCSM